MNLELDSVSKVMSPDIQTEKLNQNIQGICKKMYEIDIGSIIITENSVLFNDVPRYMKNDIHAI